MEYYSAIGEEEINLAIETIQTDIMLTEASQRKTNTIPSHL